MTALPTSGHRFAGRYRIRDVLEQHAAGGLFAAAYEPFETTVFIELIEAETIQYSRPGSDELLLQELLDCLRRMEQMRCSNLCGLIEWFEEGGFVCIASEYAAGMTLRQLLDEVGNLPLPQALEVIGACVEAAGAAYGSGIYYLALDPRNLLITTAGTVKLRRGGYHHVLEANDAILRHESLLYRAPEALQGQPSRASDVYSMAIMLREMLGSSRPPRLEAILSHATAAEPASRPAARPWFEALEEETDDARRRFRVDTTGSGARHAKVSAFPRQEPRLLPKEERPGIRRRLIALAILLLAAYLAARFIGCRPAGSGLPKPAPPLPAIVASWQGPGTQLTHIRETRD